MSHSIHTVLLLMLTITACSSKPIAEQPIMPIYKSDELQDEQRYKHFIGQPTPNSYSICLHNTCQDIAFLSLSTEQWQQISSLFIPLAKSAEQERDQIKQAIALFETFSGQQSLTYLDKAKNDLSHGSRGQLDCIDEATNSTVYLRILASANLLKWHQQSSRITRGIFSGNAPHTTATITEAETGQVFAVDSWFEDNGEPPHIVPFSDWKRGWKPN